MSSGTQPLTLNRWIGTPPGEIWNGYVRDLIDRLQDATGQKKAPTNRRVMTGALHGVQNADPSVRHGGGEDVAA